MNNKNRLTEQQIEALIPQLGLSPNILNLFKGTCRDKVMKEHYFDEDYSKPESIFLMTKEEQDVFLIDRYKPILEYHEKIYAYDTVLKGYITYTVEDEVLPLDYCYTWDGLFVPEILFWWEDEMEDEEIIHIGNYFGLKHTEEILQSIVYETDGKGFKTFEMTDNWEQRMLEKINGIIRS